MDEKHKKAAKEALIEWLESHEEDIAHQIDDFGDLHGVYLYYIGQEPSERIRWSKR